MRSDSLIDDVTIDEDDDKGHPILFNNQEIRKMLRLVEAGPNDIFYDLGSGWGQNIILAITEFKVRKAVGIEKDRERHHFSQERLKKRRIPTERALVVREDFDRILEGRAKGVDISEATVIFYGLSTDSGIIRRLQRRTKTGTRLAYYYLCLFPEIMPNRVNYPFYASLVPFRRPGSHYEWLSAIVRKSKSSIRKGKRPSLGELWEELAHDYDVERVGDRIDDYQKRLDKVL